MPATTNHHHDSYYDCAHFGKSQAEEELRRLTSANDVALGAVAPGHGTKGLPAALDLLAIPA